MKPDLYTKAILTVIALLLAVIVFRPLVRPFSEIIEGALAIFGGSNDGKRLFGRFASEVFRAYQRGTAAWRCWPDGLASA